MSARGTGDAVGDRLQKVLARAGVASRRQVEELIREGRVTVNGEAATLGQRADLARDAVKVDGRRIREPRRERRYLLLNKPAGYVSTLDDPEGRPTVIDLVPQRLRRGLVPVGRLDFETEGLLLLTDDGDLAQHVAHPRYGCSKTYEVKVKGRPSAEQLGRLREGIVLDGKRTAPAVISPRVGSTGARESVQNSWWRVILNEGRTRQIREMFFRAGHPVQRLRRVAIGPIADSELPRGACRELRDEEVELLRQRTAKPRRRKARPPATGPPRPKHRRKPSSRPPRKSGRHPSRRGPSGG